MSSLHLRLCRILICHTVHAIVYQPKCCPLLASAKRGNACLQVHEMHSWMAEHSCTRRLFSPLQLQVVLSGLDEDGQVMLSQAEDGGQDLLLRFMM